MPTLHQAQIPPPVSWRELETIVWDLCRAVWADPDTQKNGRQGQPQAGVDVYGRPNGGDAYAGVQVKLKTQPPTRVTVSELKREASKARRFVPALVQFTLVTSAPNDVRLQEAARLLTAQHQQEGLFAVAVWGWDEVQSRLAQYPDVLRRHYPQFFPSDPTEDGDRPRFAIRGTSLSRRETEFEPQFAAQQFSGDKVSALMWRYRGPHLDPMEWRTVSGLDLERTPLTKCFDLTVRPHEDDRVGGDEMGLEFRFFWRGRWRRELHRWPIVRGDVRDEILPPEERDEE